MLDLQPIKDRLEAATSWSINGDGGEFQRKATSDVYDLVAEVERLRIENQTLRELSEAKKELDDVYRMNPFYKERPDA